MVVLAANTWRSNAELIAEVAQLYIKPEDHVLDITYGRGVWWKKFRPEVLVTNDIVEGRAQFHDDFRATNFRGGNFDVVAYDPPYVSVGGRKTTTLPDLHDRYGLTGAPTSPHGLQDLIDAGLQECRRVAKPGGLILVKCQDYISSGRLWNGTFETQKAAIDWLKLEQVDRFEHIGSPRPQPAGRRQVHARRNLSTLFVFKNTTKPVFQAEGK